MGMWLFWRKSASYKIANFPNNNIAKKNFLIEISVFPFHNYDIASDFGKIVFSRIPKICPELDYIHARVNF